MKKKKKGILIQIINDCIDIEKNIFNIEKIREKINDLNSKIVQITFVPFLKDSLNDLVEPKFNYSDKDEEDREKIKKKIKRKEIKKIKKKLMKMKK